MNYIDDYNAQKILLNDFDREFDVGAKEAFRIIRRIAGTNNKHDIPASVLLEMFNGYSTDYILDKFTAEEIMRRVHEYEKEENEFHIGDEVEIINGNMIRYMVVTCITTTLKVPTEQECHCINIKDGDTCIVPLNECKKTGKHFDCIAKIIGGDNVSDN